MQTPTPKEVTHSDFQKPGDQDVHDRFFRGPEGNASTNYPTHRMRQKMDELPQVAHEPDPEGDRGVAGSAALDRRPRFCRRRNSSLNEHRGRVPWGQWRPPLRLREGVRTRASGGRGAVARNREAPRPLPPGFARRRKQAPPARCGAGVAPAGIGREGRNRRSQRANGLHDTAEVCPCPDGDTVQLRQPKRTANRRSRPASRIGVNVPRRRLRSLRAARRNGKVDESNAPSECLPPEPGRRSSRGRNWPTCVVPRKLASLRRVRARAICRARRVSAAIGSEAMACGIMFV